MIYIKSKILIRHKNTICKNKISKYTSRILLKCQNLEAHNTSIKIFLYISVAFTGKYENRHGCAHQHKNEEIKI